LVSVTPDEFSLDTRLLHVKYVLFYTCQNVESLVQKFEVNKQL
jgi:hypothetical protein